MKYIIKPILRLLAFIGFVTIVPILLLYIFTGINYDKIEEW